MDKTELKAFIDQWKVLYMSMDKRTIKARAVKGTIQDLFRKLIIL